MGTHPRGLHVIEGAQEGEENALNVFGRNVGTTLQSFLFGQFRGFDLGGVQDRQKVRVIVPWSAALALVRQARDPP